MEKNLQQIESNLFREGIRAIKDFAKNAAILKMETAKKRAEQMRNEAIISFCKAGVGAVQMGVSAASVKMATPKGKALERAPRTGWRKLPGMKGKATSRGEVTDAMATTAASRSEAWSRGTQSFGQTLDPLLTGTQNMINAELVIDQAEMEAQESIIRDTMMTFWQNMMGQSSDAEKESRDLNQQIVQMYLNFVREHGARAVERVDYDRAASQTDGR